jgi:hypothetical protein
MTGPPPTMPGIGTRASPLWDPQGWSSRYRVDSRGLG